jgi:hypothetical protein
MHACNFSLRNGNKEVLFQDYGPDFYLLVLNLKPARVTDQYYCYLKPIFQEEILMEIKELSSRNGTRMKPI